MNLENSVENSVINFPSGIVHSKQDERIPQNDISRFAHDLKQQICYLPKEVSELSDSLQSHTSEKVRKSCIRLRRLSQTISTIYDKALELELDKQKEIYKQGTEIEIIKRDILAFSSEFREATTGLADMIENHDKDMLGLLSMQVALAELAINREVVFRLNPKQIIDCASKIVEATKSIIEKKLLIELERAKDKLQSPEYETEQESVKATIVQLNASLQAVVHKRLSLKIDKELDAVFEGIDNLPTTSSQLSRILTNILSNAAKYGGSEIELEAHWLEKEENPNKGFIKITVKDNGNGIVKNISPGFSEEQINKINRQAEEILFSVGKQGSDIEKESGSGFGGANLKDLIDQIKGKINVRTKGGGIETGTEITLVIPVRKEKTSSLSVEIPTDYLPLLPTEISAFDVFQLIKKTETQVCFVDDSTINLLKFCKIFDKIHYSHPPKKLSPKNSPLSSSKTTFSETPRIHSSTHKKKPSLGSPRALLALTAKISVDSSLLTPTFPLTHKKKNSTGISKTWSNLSPSSIIEEESLFSSHISLNPYHLAFGDKHESEEEIMGVLNQSIAKAALLNSPIILIIDRCLEDGMCGDNLVKKMKTYILENHPTYTKFFYISYTANEPTINPSESPIYHGFLKKELSTESLFGAIKAAFTQMRIE